jgi:flagellar motor component MotA
VKTIREKEKHEPTYPLRSLHDFLYELNSEWDRFRTGSLIGVIVSVALLVFSFIRALSALRNRAPFDLMFMIIIIGALIYTISTLYAQHQFFKKWERRIGILLHMEEKILNKELEEDG